MVPQERPLRDAISDDLKTGSMARLGELAVERGYVTPAQLEECLQEQRTSGENMPLGQILLRRRYLSSEQFVELLGEHNRYLLLCRQCGKKYQILGFKGQALWCLVCGRELVLASAPEDLLHDSSAQTAYHPSEEEGRPGLWIGRYQIAREIARGGMGVVFEAMDPSLGRRIALKVLKEGEADLESVKRLHREAALAGKLKHPRIVMVHEVGIADGTHYIAMDYIEGTTLADRVAKGALPIREAAQIVKEVAEAVAYAHSQRVIHRDLKPSNIILDPERGPIVTDFGLAKELVGASVLTAAGALVGTPQYMAPEQIEGKDPGPMVDVYALGVILYEALVGKRPFEGTTLMELQSKVMTAEPARLRKLREDIGTDLETIAMKCLEKEPGIRYGSAQELAEDLERWLKGEAIQAHPPSTFYRVQKFVARRRGIFGAAAATLLVATVGWLIGNLVLKNRRYEDTKERARMAFERKEWNEAANWAERALEIRPDASLAKIGEESRRILAVEETRKRQKIEEGDRYRRFQEQIKPLEAVIQETRAYFYVKGMDIRSKLKDVEKALEELRVLAADPKNTLYTDIWTVMGIGWYFVGDRIRSKNALLAAVKLAPEDGRANYYLGRIYLELSQISLLANKHTVSFGEEQRNRSTEWNQKALDCFNTSSGRLGGTEEFGDHLTEVYQIFLEGKTDRLGATCKECIQYRPGGLGVEEYWVLLAQIEPDWRKREEAYTKALEIRPHYPWAYFMRGHARHVLNDLEDAMKDYTEAIRINPYFVEPYINRSSIYQDNGDFPAAIADCDTILTIDSDRLEAYNNRGSARLQSGDIDGAIEDSSKALELNPDWESAYQIRAKAREAKGDIEGASSDYTEILRINPSHSEAYNNRGLIRMKRNDLDPAIADFDAALRIPPPLPEVYFNRGLAWETKREFSRAIADYEKALKMAPRDWPYQEQVETRLTNLKTGF